ncbi:MAG: DUF2007 domain-containing protein [Bdellovibrionales bacterium]|nr:DUF2007 domain-containing protein [Bdellovibrionales bacterium]
MSKEGKFKILAEYQLAVDAHMASQYLQQHGIETFVHDEHANRIAFYSTGIFGGVKLRVKSEDFERASELLKQVHSRDLKLVDEGYKPKKPLSRKDILKSVLYLILFGLLIIYLMMIST